MDLNEIIIFAKVATHHSYTAAARQIGLPKSTVSRKVAQLEERLGIRLIQRNTRSVTLTDEGALFFEYCRRISGELEEAEAALHNLRGLPAGMLRITAPAELGSGILAEIIADFQRSFADITVDLLLTDRVVDLVEEQCDLAVRVGGLKDSSLVVRKLGETVSRCFASPDYAKRLSLPERPEDLVNHACLSFPPEQPDGWWVLTCGEETVKIQVKGPLRCNSFSILKARARAGEGIVLLPTFLAAEDLKAGALIEVLPHWRGNSELVQAVYPSRRHLTPKVRLFIDHLIQHFAPILGERE